MGAARHREAYEAAKARADEHTKMLPPATRTMGESRMQDMLTRWDAQQGEAKAGSHPKHLPLGAIMQHLKVDISNHVAKAHDAAALANVAKGQSDAAVKDLKVLKLKEARILAQENEKAKATAELGEAKADTTRTQLIAMMQHLKVDINNHVAKAHDAAALANVAKGQADAVVKDVKALKLKETRILAQEKAKAKAVH